MNRYLYSLLFAALLLSWSCEKPLEVAGPAFSVYPVSEVVKAGEEFRFRVEGQVDYLMFYSGEEGHEYKVRERTSIDQIKPLLQFSSYKQWGTKENTLKLLVSTNFSGKIDSSLADARWVDITSRAALSQGEDNISSGSINLSDFVSDKPVYLAFKYEDAYDEIKPQITWTIKDISLKNVAGTREFTVFRNAADAGFVAFDFANAQRK